jgi:hypothetical protein
MKTVKQLNRESTEATIVFSAWGIGWLIVILVVGLPTAAAVRELVFWAQTAGYLDWVLNILTALS